MLPLRDDNPTTSFAWVTFVIIVLNFAAFLFWEPTFASGPTAEGQTITFFYCHAEVPWEVSHFTSLAEGGQSARSAIGSSGILNRPSDAGAFQRYLGRQCPHKSWLLSVFAAMFLHGGWLHILGNMLFLWIFGNNVEDRIGRVIYPLFYLVSGIVASLAQLAVGPSSAVPNLGASGAIAGVLGAYLVMFPRRRVLTLIFFFIITFVSLPASVVLGLWFVLQVFDGVGALSSHVNSSGVAFWAHIGGFAFGALVALAFFPKEGLRQPPPRRPDTIGQRRVWPWGSRGRGFGSAGAPYRPDQG
jgi:membrane associated rhomboid family serine protease